MREPASKGAPPEAAPPVPIGARAWFTLAILVFMLVLSYLDRGLIALLVKPIKQSLQVSDVQIGLLYGMAFGLFYAFFSFPLGWLADRWSRRGVIWFCITIWSLATAACGLANSFWGLAIARFAVGFGEGGLSPAAYRMLGDAFPKRRMGLALGIFGAGAGLAGPISYLLGGRLVDWALHTGGATLPLIGKVEGWHLVFLILGPPGVLLAPLIFLAPNRAHADEAPAAQADGAAGSGQIGLIEFIRSRWLYMLLVFVGFGFCALFSYGVAAWAPTFYQRRFGLSMTEIGASMALVNGVATTFCFAGAGWITDRWFARGVTDAHFRYFVLCLPVVVLGGLFGLTIADQPVLAFAGMGLIWLLVPSSAAAASHLQLATPRHLRGRVSALFVMVFNVVGLTTGPVAVALLTEHVFHDPAKIGLAIATTLAVSGVAAFVLLFLAMKPARAAIAAIED
jgi:MFS family permease